MKRLLILGALALAGCASSPNMVSLGEPSGAIGGIDVWSGGTPGRAYQVIGKVQRVGSDGSATYEQEEELIAQDAKAKGADGMIVLNTVMVVSRMDLATNRPILAPKVEAELIKYQ
jgi:hypothetical protein